MIIWNGRNSDDFGIVVEHYPDYPLPQRKVDVVSLPGRNGDLIFTQNAFENVSLSYDVFFKGTVGKTSREVSEWIHGPIGYARLEDSYDADVFRIAYFDGDVDVKTVLDKYGKCTLKFSAKPQRFLKAGEQAVSFTGNGSIVNPTEYEAHPFIRVYGTGGTISVNGTSIAISSITDYIDIDCDVQDCYKGDTNCNDKVTLTKFPTLSGVSNITLGNGITRIDIVPRWWSL